MRAGSTAHRMCAAFVGRAGLASIEGVRLDAGLIGLRGWALGVRAPGLPMWVTAGLVRVALWKRTSPSGA